MMLLLCYLSSAGMPIREQIWLSASYAHYHPMGTLFYIPEDRVAFALLLDPHMQRLCRKDFHD